MNKLTVIVPMAGMGSRFSLEGFVDPKPFIDVGGKPMIQRVVESLNLPDAKYVFVCQESHITEERRLLLESLANDVVIEYIDGVTEGAAITVAVAADKLYGDRILIVNSDQLVHANLQNMVDTADMLGASGSILVFPSDGPNWSYARVEHGAVTEVREKVQISSIATAGVYYWRKASDFISSLEAMIESDDRFRGEFYVAPVYNYILPKLVTVYKCDSVDQLGTPSELTEYLKK